MLPAGQKAGWVGAGEEAKAGQGCAQGWGSRRLEGVKVSHLYVMWPWAVQAAETGRRRTR